MEQSDIRQELERRHAGSFGWALHCCRGDAAEAEEVLQTAYLKILSGQARFQERSSFGTWVFSVIRITASETRRRWARRIRALEEWWSWPPPQRPPDAEEQLRRTELGGRVRKLLEGLSARQRDVLHLVFYQELTLEETASALGISVGSARVHYHRGKQALRNRIERSGDFHDGVWRQGNQNAF